MQIDIQKPTDVILNNAFIASGERVTISLGKEVTGSVCQNFILGIGARPRNILLRNLLLPRFASFVNDVITFARWRWHRNCFNEGTLTSIDAEHGHPALVKFRRK